MIIKKESKMAVYNPFASYQIGIPKKFSDEVKKFCKQGGNDMGGEYAPFNRQVDFWYFAFLYALQEKLTPEAIPSGEMTNITAASILSNFHIIHIQMAYLATCLDIEKLDEPREMFTYVSNLANAGIPYVLQILKDSEEGKPLFNILDTIEEYI